MITRRELLSEGFMTAAGCALAGCAIGGAGKKSVVAHDFTWGVLLHLGSNMWKDWIPGVHYPQSAAEEAAMVADGKLKFTKSHLYATRDYFSTNWDCWRQEIKCARQNGLNTIFIDIGEAYAYPSHPELHVRGSLKPDEMRKVVDEIRALGMEPIPKLNFSTGHDQWLREYHYMTSSPTYYRVVADLIRDVCEVFDKPRYFHLGFDEEIFAACGRRQVCVMRQGDAWWKDFLFCVKEVEKQGARAMLWSDKICGGREEFFKRMPKTVLQVTWYYGRDFSDPKLVWKPQFEKSQEWNIQTNLAASIVAIAEAGYDIMPCTSNWESDDAADAMLGFCKKRIAPERIKGFFTAPWRKPVPEDTAKTQAGIRQLAEAKRKYEV